MIEEMTEACRIPADAQRRLKATRDEAGGPSRLFTSDLSVNEFLMVQQAGFEPLRRTGYRPLEMAMGNCVYHTGVRGLRQTLGQLGQNVEMTKYTQALYDAREWAMERMQEEAKAVKAQGIVGVQILQANHGW